MSWGEILFSQNDANDFIWIVIEGEVRLSKVEKIRCEPTPGSKTKLNKTSWVNMRVERNSKVKHVVLGLKGKYQMVGKVETAMDLERRIYTATVVSSSAKFFKVQSAIFKKKIATRETLDAIVKQADLRYLGPKTDIV